MKKGILLFSLILFSSLLYSYNNPSKVSKLLNKLQNNQGKERVDILIKLSGFYRTTSFHSCIEYGREAIQYAKTTKDSSVIAKANFSMGNNYLKSSDAQNSLPYFKNALTYFQKDKNLKERIITLNKIGTSFAELSDYVQAEYYLNKALDLARKNNYKMLIADALSTYGAIKIHKKQYKVALDMYSQMRRIGEENNSKKIIGESYIGLGILSNYMEAAPGKALKYFEKARIIFNKLGDKELESRVLSNMAATYANYMNEFKKALHFYEQSLKIKRDINDNKGIALLENNIGILYAQTGNLSTAAEFINKSLHLYKQIDNKSGIAMTLFNLGDIYLEQEKFTEALRYYKESYELCKKTGYNEYLYESCKRIFQCYAGLGDFNKFINYYTIYENHVDSVITALRKQQIELTEKDFDINDQNSISDSNKNSKSVPSFYLINHGIIFAALALLLVFIIFLLLHNYKKKNH